MKNIKRLISLTIVLIMLSTFVINASAATIYCKVYSFESYKLPNVNNKDDVEAVLYIRPTLTTYSKDPTGYRVSTIEAYIRLNPTAGRPYKYFNKVGLIYTVTVKYQIKGSYATTTSTYSAWSYLGNIAKDGYDGSLYSSPTCKITIPEPPTTTSSGEIGSIVSYYVEAEIVAYNSSVNYPSGTYTGDYIVMTEPLSLSTIVSQNT